MLLTQFKGLDIYSYKAIDRQSKMNILSILKNKFDIP
jgi:hypothetical protein